MLTSFEKVFFETKIRENEILERILSFEKGLIEKGFLKKKELSSEETKRLFENIKKIDSEPNLTLEKQEVIKILKNIVPELTLSVLMNFNTDLGKFSPFLEKEIRTKIQTIKILKFIEEKQISQQKGQNLQRYYINMYGDIHDEFTFNDLRDDEWISVFLKKEDVKKFQSKLKKFLWG